MNSIDFSVLTKAQREVIEAANSGSIFVHGLAGCGKTTVGVFRTEHILRTERGIRENVLVLVPQRVLSRPYQQKIQGEISHEFGRVSLLTFSSLVRRMVRLFWPLIGERGGFYNPYQAPKFLTIETAQYYMAHLVNPLLDQGYFSTVSMKRNRLFSQLLDNLNKSAIVGFPFSEIGARLKEAWVGDPAQLNVYDDVQRAISQFRAFCLQNNLLDFSLQVELFRDFIWPESVARRYIAGAYQHLIYDNIEEDPPYVHDILADWLPYFKSALLIMDDNAGYRNFLGADPISASRFEALAANSVNFAQTFVPDEKLLAVRQAFVKPTLPVFTLSLKDVTSVLIQPEKPLRFFPEVMDFAVQKIRALVAEGVRPSQISIIAPYLSDYLIFNFSAKLDQSGIPYHAIHPSTALNTDPFIQCLVTLVLLAHPDWGLPIYPNQITVALVQSIEGLDPIRAELYYGGVFKASSTEITSNRLGDLAPDLQERIGSEPGAKLDILLDFLTYAPKAEPLDIFLSRLISEVLSQPGFGFHVNFAAGKSASNLIESYRKFHLAVTTTEQADAELSAAEFIQTLQMGLISALHLPDWQSENDDSILIAPATTFIMQNCAVDYQFWLEVGSSGWYERLEQPLTHPYVLSRNWQQGHKWTSQDESNLANQNLDRIFSGLIMRCRKGIFLGISQYDETGNEARGLMLTRIQNLFRHARKVTENG